MFVVFSPLGIPDPALAVAASRAGALGVINLSFRRDLNSALGDLDFLEAHARNPYGVLVNANDEALLVGILARKYPGLSTIIIAPRGSAAPGTIARTIKAANLEALLVVTTLKEARAAEDEGFDAVIAKGSESGGWVGEETAFILTQHLVERIGLPVWVQGGVGLHTAAACIAAGAAGVVLDSQVLLTRESQAPDGLRTRLEGMDGSETEVINASFRCYSRPDIAAAVELKRQGEADSPDTEEWLDRVCELAVDPHGDLWPVGQDAAFAAGLARRFVTVGGVVGAMRESISQHLEAAARQRSLAEGAALAQRHGTRYPIVQGPMTRVSDSAHFAEAVAEAGALPFVALALMRGEEVESLLIETSKRLAGSPWGVGILGFVPAELREEQLGVIHRVRPPYALIAGGRPDQAKSLEAEGIPTYLHVPSPGLLRLFLDDGARRFVFEGRECGGHIGPRTSFVLWESMIEVLLDFIRTHPGVEISVLFAGGISDGLSTAMVAAMAAPLVEQGAGIGVLAGTAYLFTHEAVGSRAIQGAFQEAAVAADATATIEATTGYATRCLPSPFIAAFDTEKRRLIREGVAGEDLKNSLELLNIGRLRIASKGVDHNPDFGKDPDAPRLLSVEPEAQWQQGMYMIGQVTALRSSTCSLAELHEDLSAAGVERLLRYRGDAYADPQPPPVSVAIVGMATLLPGAGDLDTYWANILNKVDAVDEVPESRWDAGAYFDVDRAARDKVYSRWGGFIGEVPFDPVEFGMPPNSLPFIEPFQLLALLVVRDALKDAGYDARPFNRERTSVIFGGGGGGSELVSAYTIRSNLPRLVGDDASKLIDSLEGFLPEWTEDSFPGVLMNVAAGRVANRFDFGGVNFTVDAACASSLAAVFLGVRELQAGTSDVVIAGGVDATQSPFGFLCFGKTQALSPSGRSKPFDAEADGIAISEGFAALVLKRLEDAERDGDRVYAVIKGVGGSSDGRDRSLTAPRPAGQVRAYTRAYANAGFSPATVGLIEAHGTGTVAGDQSEIESLKTVFKGATARGTAIGSVKSMIGHTKSTAGVAGLSKVAKALHHRVLPPTLGVSRPNLSVDGPETPFYINSEARPWIRAGNAPRRAGVSAFGFGGTNFHIAVEEYEGDFLPGREPASAKWPAEVFLWRAESPAVLADRLQALLGQLDSGASPGLADLAYTSFLEAKAGWGDVRLTAVVGSLEELRQRLRGCLEGGLLDAVRVHAPDGTHYSREPMGNDGVAFLFPGQGSQYTNMTRELAVVFPEVREEFELADQLTAGSLRKRLSAFVFPPPSFDVAEERASQDELTATDVAQPALGVTETALLRLLDGLGVRPAMAAGHSYGELVALQAAGVLTREALLDLSVARGRAMKDVAGDDAGSMAAIAAAPEALAGLLAQGEVVLANLNSPRQTVISGPSAAIHRAIEWCATRGLTARKLPVASAFHSPLVAQARQRFSDLLGSVDFGTPAIPVFSNTSGGRHADDGSAIRSVLGDHLVSPVRFVDEVEAMYAAGARVFLEAGPKQVLTGLTGQILGERPHVAVSLDHAGRGGLWSLLNAIGAAYVEGVPVDFTRLYEGRRLRHHNVSRLADETRPRFTETTWLVHGSGARPASREATVRKPISLGVVSVEPPDAVRPVREPPLPTGNGARPAKASAGATSMPPDSTAGVMQHFQDVMDRFLDLQQTTMSSLLRVAATAPNPAPPRPDTGQPATGWISADGHDPAPSGPPIKRYLPRVIPLPAAIPAALDPSGVVVIAGGPPPLTHALIAALKSRGYSACGADAYTHSSEREGTGSEVTRASGLVYLDALGDSREAGISGSTARAAEFFSLAQALGPELKRASANGGACVIAATTMGGDFALGGSADVGGGWLPGFLKSLAREWPAVRVKAVDLASVDVETTAQKLLYELLGDAAVTEVGYSSDGSRQTVGLEPSALLGGSPVRDLPRAAVVLVTGGGRGITAEACVALAERGPCTFVLVGRTGPSGELESPSTAGVDDERAIKTALADSMRTAGGAPTPVELEKRFRGLMRERELASTINRLAALGSRVDYRACDVAEAEAFEVLIDDVYAQYGCIDAAIHGAGVIEDRLIEDKTLASLQRVMATKVNGADVLARKLRLDGLRFLAFFSSMTARFGNAGQCDYAAANEALNKLAAALDRDWPCRVVALGWGPWLTKGMVSPEVQRQFVARGVGLIPIEEGRRFFLEEVLYGEKGQPEVVIGGFDEPALLHPLTLTERVRASDQVASASDGCIDTASLPLLTREALARAVDGAQQIARTLSVERDLYLADHVMDGRPVLPFAVAMELMTEAACLVENGAHPAGLRDVRVSQGIVLEQATERVVLDVRPDGVRHNGHAAPVDVFIKAASNGREHYRAAVDLGFTASSDLAARAIAVAQSSVSSNGSAPGHVTAAAAYRDWLFHGPLFQAIESVDAIGPAGISGRLRASDPAHCVAGEASSRWIFDPILLDAGFQMQLIWGRMYWDLTLLPSRVERLAALDQSRLRALRPGDIVRFELRIRPESSKPFSHSDLVFLDAAGRPLCMVLDLEGTGSAELNRLGGKAGPGVTNQI